MLTASKDTARSEIMERMRTAFRAEALDLLPELDAALLAMELEPHNIALVNRVFRAMHTIKGSGATAGFAHLAHFAHGVEEAFDLARSGKLAVTSELIDCGLKACDVIREILNMEEDEHEANGESAVAEAVARLLPAAAAAIALVPPPGSHAAKSLSAYRITFRPHVDLFRTGTDPLSLLDDLRGLGTARVTANLTELPPLASMDPESCFLGWEILLLSACGEEAIREVFLFVEDDCRIDIHLLPHQAECIAFLLLPAQEREDALHHHAATCLAIASKAIDAMAISSRSLAQHAPTYLQALPPLSIAALCEQHVAIEEAAATQTRILARLIRVGRPIGPQDRRRLNAALHTVRSISQNHPQRENLTCA